VSERERGNERDEEEIVKRMHRKKVKYNFKKPR
jgi:hypothetical protein